MFFGSDPKNLGDFESLVAFIELLVLGEDKYDINGTVGLLAGLLCELLEMFEEEDVMIFRTPYRVGEPR